MSLLLSAMLKLLIFTFYLTFVCVLSLPASLPNEKNRCSSEGIVVSDEKNAKNECLTDECVNNPCLNGGKCENSKEGEGHSCNCPEEYTGKVCEIRKEIFSDTGLNQSRSVGSSVFYYVTNNGYVHQAKLENGKLPQFDKDVTAWAIFENTVNKTGWATLEVHTLEGIDDELQAYSAGLIEGAITGPLIVLHWKNLHANYCSEDPEYCSQLKSFLKENRDFINEKLAQLGETDPYWHQVKLVYQQIYGLQVGFDRWLVGSEYYHDEELQVDPIDLYVMNLVSESDTLEMIVGKEGKKHILGEGHCSALIKPLPDGSDIFVAHNTWSDFDSMLRIMKKYDFKFRTLPNTDKTQLIPGHTLSFSSYPGSIFSEDDYYVISSGLVVLETTNENFNEELYKNIHANGIVFEFIRNIVANRLATSGKEWTELFSENNSGTYNNQFMVVDYKQFTPGTKAENLKDGTLWIVEQMPTLVHSGDVTQVIREKGYWSSYNVAYFEDIFNISDASRWAKKYGDFYTHDRAPRAQIFARDQGNVKDMKSLFTLMRYNDFKNDPLSRCDMYNQTCDPPYSADNAISSRNDLNDPEGNYPLSEWTHRGEGAIDLKVTNYEMAKSLQMIAISGPTYQQQPTFKWSTTSVKNMKHQGHPDVFDFPPYNVKWYPDSWQEMKGLVKLPKD